MEDIFRPYFDQHDTDKDGYLSNAELKEFLRDGAEQLTDKQTALLMKLLDNDGDGKLDFNEFLEIVNGSVFDFTNEESIRRFFRVFDTDNTGLITKENLREVMEVINKKLEIDDNELENAIKEADTNGDGKVNYEVYENIEKLSDKLHNAMNLLEKLEFF